MKRALACLALLALGPDPVRAAPTLAMPNHALSVRQDVIPVDSVAVPVGPWAAGTIPTENAEGEVTMTAWQVPGQTSTLALVRPLREQLRTEGFDILYECATDACGGFDFRYALTVLPEPEIHVDLGDFRYLAARKGTDYVMLLASRSERTGFVQLTRIGATQPLPVAIVPPEPPAAGEPPPAGSAAAPPALPADTTAADLGARLEGHGAVALDDLVFASGSSELGAGDFASLAALAEYLKAHPESRVTLVGHTDASGALSANVALSRQRAQSVLTRLVAEYGVPPVQLAADGVGFLSPRASNLTEAGRQENRRVEVILTSTR